MIKSLSFENFRGFPSLTIDPLRRVNLIAGANNTGKTGILEGLFLLAANLNEFEMLPSVFRVGVHEPFGRVTPDDFFAFWKSIRNVNQPDAAAKIRGYVGDHKDLEGIVCRIESRGSVDEIRLSRVPTTTVGNADVQYSLLEDGVTIKPGNVLAAAGATSLVMVVSTHLQSPATDSDLYNQVTLRSDGEERLLELLRVVDPRLEKLRYLKAPGTSQPLVYAYFGQRNGLSINQTGQGFNKLFALFCRMILAEARVLLIDEVENGLYYETLPQIWRGIEALAQKEDIQVFATTHSRECIVAAHKAMAGTPNYDFALHRLQRVKDKIEVVTHDREMMDEVVAAEMEVR